MLLVTQLSYSAYGQGISFPDPSDYDYTDFAGFRAVASPAVLPARLGRQFQATTRGALPPVDDSRRHQVGRGEAVPQDVVQREEPKVVNILKQINE